MERAATDPGHLQDAAERLAATELTQLVDELADQLDLDSDHAAGWLVYAITSAFTVGIKAGWVELQAQLIEQGLDVHGLQLHVRQPDPPDEEGDD